MKKKKIDVSLLATTTTTLLFVVLLIYSSCSSNTAHAALYIVGDSKGWTFNVSGWEKSKNFLEGDTLVFNYPPGVHNVLSVDKFNYESCTLPADAKPLFDDDSNNNNSAATPNDVNAVTLTIGANYFICGIPRHCAKGMRIAPIAE